MNRFSGIIIVGLVALSLGLAAALFKTQKDARSAIYKLQDEIQDRTAFGPGRHGNRGGDRGNNGGRNDSFGKAMKALDLNEDQVLAFRQMLSARREARRSVVRSIRSQEAAMKAAMTAEPLDPDAIRAIRNKVRGQLEESNLEAQNLFFDFLSTLTPKQRESLVELAGGSPNSLLFL